MVWTKFCKISQCMSDVKSIWDARACSVALYRTTYFKIVMYDILNFSTFNWNNSCYINKDAFYYGQHQRLHNLMSWYCYVSHGQSISIVWTRVFMGASYCSYSADASAWLCCQKVFRFIWEYICGRQCILHMCNRYNIILDISFLLLYSSLNLAHSFYKWKKHLLL